VKVVVNTTRIKSLQIVLTIHTAMAASLATLTLMEDFIEPN